MTLKTHVAELVSSTPTDSGQLLQLGWRLEPQPSRAWEGAFKRAWAQAGLLAAQTPIEFVDGKVFYSCRLADAADLLGLVKRAAKLADKA